MFANISKQAKMVACASLIVLPEAALAWRAWNRHEVLDVSPGVYEVIAKPGYGTSAKDYWCAIGDYAIRILKTSAVQRVYLWAPVGPSVNQPGRKAVQFSLQPPPGANTNPRLSLSTKQVGDNLSASSAQSYCYDGVSEQQWLPGQ